MGRRVQGPKGWERELWVGTIQWDWEFKKGEKSEAERISQESLGYLKLEPYTEEMDLGTWKVESLLWASQCTTGVDKLESVLWRVKKHEGIWSTQLLRRG